jgi:hypothetical protein
MQVLEKTGVIVVPGWVSAAPGSKLGAALLIDPPFE